MSNSQYFPIYIMGMGPVLGNIFGTIRTIRRTTMSTVNGPLVTLRNIDGSSNEQWVQRPERDKPATWRVRGT